MYARNIIAGSDFFFLFLGDEYETKKISVKGNEQQHCDKFFDDFKCDLEWAILFEHGESMIDRVGFGYREKWGQFGHDMLGLSGVLLAMTA